MTFRGEEAMPVRGSAHEALSMFLGVWRAKGILTVVPVNWDQTRKQMAHFDSTLPLRTSSVRD